jgi:hypothetical protein
VARGGKVCVHVCVCVHACVRMGTCAPVLHTASSACEMPCRTMPLWRREPPPPPPPPVTSSTELGFLLDPSVEQLILALYQQVAESGGHFFVEVRVPVRAGPRLARRPPRSALRRDRRTLRGPLAGAPCVDAHRAPVAVRAAPVPESLSLSRDDGRPCWCWPFATCSSRNHTSPNRRMRSRHRYPAPATLREPARFGGLTSGYAHARCAGNRRAMRRVAA